MSRNGYGPSYKVPINFIEIGWMAIDVMSMIQTCLLRDMDTQKSLSISKIQIVNNFCQWNSVHTFIVHLKQTTPLPKLNQSIAMI